MSEAALKAYAARPISQFDPLEIDPFRSYAEVFNGDIPAEVNEEIIYSCRPTQTGKDTPAGIAMPALMGGMNGLNLTQDVVDAFYMADGSSYSLPEKHWEAIGADKKFSGYTLKGNAAKMYDNREMRFYVSIGFNGRVNQRVQHYEIFLKKTSAGVEKLSFSLGLALIFFLILVIFPSVTVLMSVPFGIYCRISLLPFSMAPFCHAQ